MSKLITIYSIASCLEVGIIEAQVQETEEHYVAKNKDGEKFFISKDNIDIYTNIELARISANARRLKEIVNLRQQIERLEKLNF